MGEHSLVEVANLHRRYGDVHAVQGLDFRLRRGEVLGFLGPNGAGKTTTMQMICGVLAPSEGAVRIGGVDLFERPIEDLAELSVRSRNSLQKESIRTLGDLVQRSEEAMLQIENFGKKSLKEISDFLEEHSLRFGMQLEQGEDGRLFFVEDEAEAAAGGEE